MIINRCLLWAFLKNIQIKKVCKSEQTPHNQAMEKKILQTKIIALLKKINEDEDLVNQQHLDNYSKEWIDIAKEPKIRKAFKEFNKEIEFLPEVRPLLKLRQQENIGQYDECLMALYLIQNVIYTLEDSKNYPKVVEEVMICLIRLAFYAKKALLSTEVVEKTAVSWHMQKMGNVLKDKVIEYLERHPDLISSAELYTDGTEYRVVPEDGFELIEDIELKTKVYYPIINESYDQVMSGESDHILYTEGILAWTNMNFKLNV